MTPEHGKVAAYVGLLAVDAVWLVASVYNLGQLLRPRKKYDLPIAFDFFCAVTTLLGLFLFGLIAYKTWPTVASFF